MSSCNGGTPSIAFGIFIRPRNTVNFVPQGGVWVADKHESEVRGDEITKQVSVQRRCKRETKVH